MDNKTKPVVLSIGMPVYNGENVIKKSLDSLLSQSFTDFELIISDNASTDSTEDICRNYAALDNRIKYIRQDNNLGMYSNFLYVLEMATGKYFMWNAADDCRSPDYIECNIEFLESNPEFVASTSPNCYEGEEELFHKHIQFEIEGNLYERLKILLVNCWHSHGLFYALIRLSILREINLPKHPFIAEDWLIDMYLLTKGPIKRITKGLLISGKGGISNSENPYAAFRSKKIEYVFPLYEFTIRFINTIILSDELTSKQKTSLVNKLITLNYQTGCGQIYIPYLKLKKFIKSFV